MPLTPDQRAAYGPDWAAVRDAIRERSADRCECTGQCGTRGAKGRACLLIIGQGERCEARNGGTSWRTGSKIVLTVAHLDDNPGVNNYDRLLHMCQGCHLAYDILVHQARRAANRRSAQNSLFGEDTNE